VNLTYTRTTLKSQKSVLRNPNAEGFSVVDTIKGGKKLISKNGDYAAVLNQDGIFATRRVLKANPMRNKLESVDIWRSHEKPKGTGPFSVILTFEGNVELVDSKETLIWESDTRNRGAAPYKLIIQDDGNLVLKDSKKAVIWDSFKDNERKLNSSKIGGNIVQTGETDMIINWLGKKADFELCYRASIHGKSSSEFHNRCDGKGASITFVKTTNGFRFGGFTSRSWNGNNNNYEYNDSSAFVFSLDKQTKLGYYYSYGIYNNMSYGPTFGGGHDFHINSNMSWGYVNVHSFRNGGESSYYLVNGNWGFTPEEVEV